MADENIVDEVVDTKVVTDEVKIDPAEIPQETLSAPLDWPSDWREKAAGGDEKKLARLQRYASPVAMADALAAAQNKIASGEYKQSIGKDAKPEEIAAYREAHGIPETADKYDLNGIELDDSDKDLVKKYTEAAHGVNMTPEQVRTSIEAYKKINEEVVNQRMADDEAVKTQAEDKLRSEWGNDYRTNINLVTNFLDTAPVGFRDKLLHGRLSDGTPIGSSVEALQFLAGLARERNPAGVVVPSGVATESAMLDEIAKIEKVMRENRREYNRDEAMQARYRQLLEWRENQRVRRVA